MRAGKINEDVVVPVSEIAVLVARLQELAREVDIPIVSFGHAGNGNIHVNLLFDPKGILNPGKAPPPPAGTPCEMPQLSRSF